ncbi:MAG: hypothetical protein OEZ43_01155 [Gammaproteobacteria bacterium]|nr:hypothetical protein [Gammaproteobacteria bacterium]
MKIASSTFILLIVLLLIGCGGGANTYTEISGRISKGVISKAKVSAYSLNEEGKKTLLGTTHSDNSGRYKIRLTGSHLQPILLQASADTDTKMKCDTQIGCKATDDSDIAFGEDLILDEKFELEAIIPILQIGEDNFSNINFYTHLASKLAIQRIEQQTEKFNALSVAKANSKISDLLQDLNIIGISDDAHTIELVDVANKQEISNAIENEKDSQVLFGVLQASTARLITQQLPDTKLYSETISGFSKTYIDNNGELKLYSKTASFSVQALLEGMREELKGIEGFHQDLVFSPYLQKIESELDELNIDTDKKPEKEKSEKKKEEATPDSSETGPDQPGPQPEPEPEPEPEPVDDDNDEQVDESATTKTGFYSEIEKLLFNEIDSGKRLITSLRTMGHTIDENSALLGKKLLNSMGGEINVEQVTDDFLGYVDIAKTLYPKVGGVVLAMIKMGEAESDLVYDLALDKDNYLPEGLDISGTVTATTKWGSRYLVLNNGFIEGLGQVELEVRAWRYYYCYYCYNSERVSINLKVSGEYGSISMRTWGADLDRSWSWAQQTYIPRALNISDADIEVTLHKAGAKDSLRINNAGMDLRLRWPYGGSTILPTVDYVAVDGYFYNYDYDNAISSFRGRLSYNNNSWMNYSNDPVQWAKHHANYFSVNASFNAYLRVPDPNRPSYTQYKSVKVEAGLQKNSWRGLVKSMSIRYDNEYFSFEHQDGSSQINIANRAGAMVEAILDPDAKELILGNITVKGKQVASIENTELGPIIRYADGTIESF